MIRHLVSIALVMMFMSATLGAAANVPARSSESGVRRNNRRYEIELQRQIDELQAQMTRLNAKKSGLIGKLEAIAAQAKKEKAQETVQQVQQLMEQINSSHAAERKNLDKKLSRIKQVAQKIGRKEKLEKNVGSRARGFTLKDSQGKDVGLNDHKGKIIVLEWMSPECPYSRYYYEKKIIPRLVRQYKDEGVVWLTINSSSGATAKQNQAFVKRYGLTHPVLNDVSGMVARTYGARKTGHIFIIDRRGMIAYNGAIDDSPAKGGKQQQVNSYAEKALAQLVAGKPVSMSYSEPIGSPLGRSF
jgi:peroxiredoxin